MASKTDIVSLKWVIGLMNKQTENAEMALVDYSKDLSQKKPLLQCMWAIHQITSTLRALGMKKGEMLTVEMERSLNFLYKDKVIGERRKLTMGGLMQALKILPAYLAHTQNVRQDTGRGLEQYVNDLRRWVGERPRPQAFFFHMDISKELGITAGASPASDEEIMSRANVMLALYLEMAKSALRKRNVGESMKTVARISRKMQTLFVGTEPERFWLTQIGLCEGIAGGLIVPDECIAQIFKTGAFLIKYARENGAEIDKTVDYDSCLEQMLYYIASCKSKPVHISNIRNVFGVDEETLVSASSGLVHIDALVTAISSALEQLNVVIQHIGSNDTTLGSEDGSVLADALSLESIENAQIRLTAAGQGAHADSLQAVYDKLSELSSGQYVGDEVRTQQAVNEVVRGIVDVKLDLEYKLEYGLCSSFSSKEFELRESVVSATFTQMSLVENNLHTVLRRKALAAALVKKPFSAESIMQLTLALHRYLNKSDQGHEELRKALSEADNGEADIDLLFELAQTFFSELPEAHERHAIGTSLRLLDEITGALGFAGMDRESEVIEQCSNWLSAASKAGSVREDEAFRCFADAFAQIELHLQRSIIDPLDDTSHMMALAEQRAQELQRFSLDLSNGSDVVASVALEPKSHVQDGVIPTQFRDVFIEEAEDISTELLSLLESWIEQPVNNSHLQDIRRHFHTFKGNGRAVGANTLGELGWAAQDMLDRVIDGELAPNETLQTLLADVINALPGLVSSFGNIEGFNVDTTRHLTDKCFRLANSGGVDMAEELQDIAPASTSHSRPPVANTEQAALSQPVGH
ncbi:MAG: HPt (histidine-containing phosphotransfer) domain-containing protein [Halioglobus sp.]|jgi:HPt (histidine-containing phosphotransfer) domain-containing protein